MASTELTKLIEDVRTKIWELEANNHNERLRQELIRTTRSLVNQLETPQERVARMAYFDFSLYPVTRVLIDLGVFRQLDSASKSLAVSQLAEASGADVRLLERLLKHVAVVDFIRETGPDEYAANKMTSCLASSGAEGLLVDIYQASKPFESLPDYFQSIGYTNPLGKDKSAYYRIYGQHMFDYLFAPGHEKAAEAFHNHMRFKSFGMKWFEVPGIMDALFERKQNLSDDQALIVDVGGSTGHALIDFASSNPHIKGRQILQDLPTCIDTLDKDYLASYGIEAMSHDFFTPQPITNAKAYYLKMVLHDWPAEQCVQILSSIRSAMKPGYSRILLNEFVIPETGARDIETGLDILMMAVHGAQERREREWKELVEQVEGLQIRKIWLVEGQGESIVEIELVVE